MKRQKNNYKRIADWANIKLAQKEVVTLKDMGLMIAFIAPMVTLLYIAAHYAIS